MCKVNGKELELAKLLYRHIYAHHHDASECQGQREVPKSFDGPRIKHVTTNKGSQVRLASPERTTMLMAKDNEMTLANF